MANLYGVLLSDSSSILLSYQNTLLSYQNTFLKSFIVLYGLFSIFAPVILIQEELKRAQATEREKRAAAAERRIAAAAVVNAQGSSTTTVPSMVQSKSGLTTDINCSCCNSSLAGKVPFHRYHYKYCSTSCMHVHREILEDG